MEQYIGVKLIKAEPMTRQEYNDYRGWELPSGENGGDEGRLVEYLDGGEPNHPNHKGYISWSPLEVFKNAYREVEGMTFGLAIEAMKLGHKVCRAGWNGKGMFAYIVPAGNYHAQTEVARDHFGDGGGKPNVPYGAYIAMKTAQHNVTPWLASQTDMLEEDWMIVE